MAKNIIWTTLKVIFSIFRFVLYPQISDSCISAKYCPILTNNINGKIIYSVFRLCINLKYQKLALMIGFVVQGMHSLFLRGTIWRGLTLNDSDWSSFSAEVHTAKASYFHNKINSASDTRNLFKTFNFLLYPPPPPP